MSVCCLAGLGLGDDCYVVCDRTRSTHRTHRHHLPHVAITWTDSADNASPDDPTVIVTDTETP